MWGQGGKGQLGTLGALKAGATTGQHMEEEKQHDSQQPAQTDSGAQPSHSAEPEPTQRRQGTWPALSLVMSLLKCDSTPHAVLGLEPQLVLKEEPAAPIQSTKKEKEPKDISSHKAKPRTTASPGDRGRAPFCTLWVTAGAFCLEESFI